MLPAQEFIRQLGEENEAFFRQQPQWATSYWAESMCPEATVHALRMRYWNEYQGFKVLARFMYRVSDPMLRMMVGRQVGDEAKHAFYMKQRILELNGDLGGPLPEQEEFYRTLDEFSYPEEFFAAQQFTVETQSIRRNEQALKNFDNRTASIFCDFVCADEIFHVQLGQKGMAFYCITEAAQERARKAARLIRDIHVAMSLASHNCLVMMGLI
jgi:hypothetical protein